MEGSSSHICLEATARKMEPFKIAPETIELIGGMDLDDLIAFAGVYEELASDSDAELFIFCHSMLFKRTKSSDCLQVAIDRATAFVTSTPPEHPDHPRRCTILTHLMNLNDDGGFEKEEMEDKERKLAGSTSVAYRLGLRNLVDIRDVATRVFVRTMEKYQPSRSSDE